MNLRKNDTVIQDKIKKILENPPQYKFSEAGRRKLIARLYEIDAERKTVVDFMPVWLAPRFAIAALTLALFIFGYRYFFMPLYPVALGAKGDVHVYRLREGKWISADKGKIRLCKGDIIKTSKDAAADIVIPGIYHMRVKDNSELAVCALRSRISKDCITHSLSEGRVYVYYDKRQKKNFEIETAEAILSVSGTGFMVERTPDKEKTWVGVLDGAVKVTGRKISKRLPRPEMASVLVEAGEKTTVEHRRIPAEPTRLVENELLELEELYRIGERPQVALLISTGKTRVRELLSFTPLYISSETDTVLPAKIKETAVIFDEAMKTGSKEKHIDTIKKFEEIVKTRPDPKYDVQFLLFIGAYYEYLDEHEKAINTFQRVIDEYPSSHLKSLAQCAIAIIYEEKLGSPNEARLAYTKVLTNYPLSPEVPEAESGLERLK